MSDPVENAFAEGFTGKAVPALMAGRAATDMPNMANFNAAHEALKMTPEEQALYQRHLANLQAGGVKNPDGSTSTLYQTSFEQNGRVYNIPTVWKLDGKTPVIVPPAQAVKLANMEGIDKFPSYPDADTAEARYEAMHEFMERDIGRAAP